MEDIKAKQKIEEEVKQEEVNEQKDIEEKIFGEISLKRKKESILPEPPISDPSACEIAFRLPSGKRITRRFSNKTNIQILYNYIETLEDNGLDQSKFEISQAVPKKVYSDMNKTLEEEGLAPKSAIQVVILDDE